jgi:ATP-dependent DNA ligase
MQLRGNFLNKGETIGNNRRMSIPMLATLVDELPGDEQNGAMKINWDGYRGDIAYLKQRSREYCVRVTTRSFNWRKFYPGLWDARKDWSESTPSEGIMRRG